MTKCTIVFDEVWGVGAITYDSTRKFVGYGVDKASAKEATISQLDGIRLAVYNGESYALVTLEDTDVEYLKSIKFKEEKYEVLTLKKQFYFWSMNGTTGVNEHEDGFGGHEYAEYIANWSINVFDALDEAMVAKARFGTNTSPVSEGWSFDGGLE